MKQERNMNKEKWGKKKATLVNKRNEWEGKDEERREYQRVEMRKKSGKIAK